MAARIRAGPGESGCVCAWGICVCVGGDEVSARRLARSVGSACPMVPSEIRPSEPYMGAQSAVHSLVPRTALRMSTAPRSSTWLVKGVVDLKNENTRDIFAALAVLPRPQGRPALLGPVPRRARSRFRRQMPCRSRDDGNRRCSICSGRKGQAQSMLR